MALLHLHLAVREPAPPAPGETWEQGWVEHTVAHQHLRHWHHFRLARHSDRPQVFLRFILRFILGRGVQGMGAASCARRMYHAPQAPQLLLHLPKPLPMAATLQSLHHSEAEVGAEAHRGSPQREEVMVEAHPALARTVLPTFATR